MNKTISRIRIWTVCGIAIVIALLAVVYMYTADSHEDLDSFMTKSSNGIACKTIIKEDGYKTELSYDGKQYSAERSDGTVGSGKFLSSLTGKLPQSTSDITYLVISDTEYTFKDISNDILGLSDTQLDYFLVQAN